MSVGPPCAVRRAALLLLSGLLLGAAYPETAAAQSAPTQRTDVVHPFATQIEEAARRFGIPAAWIRAVIRAESAGDVHAISPAGAMGLMQIIPATWAKLRVRLSLGNDPYDPRDNILAGAAYLGEMHDRYGSPGFLAAYNAGPARYEEYLAGRPLPAETRAYIAALVSTLGGGGLPDAVTIAVAHAHVWTHAPLFVVHRERTAKADPVHGDRLSGILPDANSLHGISAFAPQRSRLFVPRAESGGAR